MSQRMFNKKQEPVPAEDSTVNNFSLMNALLDEHSKLLKDLRDVEKAKIPDGKTFPMSFTLDINSNKVAHFDFLDDSDTRGVPAGAYSNAPYVKLRRVVIYNDGPGAINAATNNTPAMSISPGGTINDDGFLDIDFGFAVIESLTVALATGATQSAAVRVIGFT